jgi:glutathione S-transferase
MAPRPVLTGYSHSVYTRVARIALAEKQVAYDTAEHDPFAATGAENPHPFGRVPVLRHGRFEVYETAAITGYVDTAFEGPALMPTEPQALARATQVIAMVDAYVYWPLVRQVYSHAVFRPAMGEAVDAAVLQDGLAAAPAVLSALEAVAGEGLVLSDAFGRAECHLAAMMAAFVQAEAGAAMLARSPELARWWAGAAKRPSVVATQTPLPTAGNHD